MVKKKNKTNIRLNTWEEVKQGTQEDHPATMKAIFVNTTEMAKDMLANDLKQLNY